LPRCKSVTLALPVWDVAFPEAEELSSSLGHLSFRSGLPIHPDADLERDIDRLLAGVKSG
jgi:hypothetical protein